MSTQRTHYFNVIWFIVGKQKIKHGEERYQTLEKDCQTLRESNKSLNLEKINLEKELQLTKANVENLQTSNLENLKNREKEYETCK